MEGVQQKTAKKAFRIKKVKPIVEIVPHFPGCICTPSRLKVNVTPERVEARMWITPLCEGDLQDARVEVWYEGKKINSVETPCKITTQAIAKLMGVMTFMAPFASMFLEAYGLDPKTQASQGFPIIKSLLKIVQIPYFTVFLILLFAGLGVFFYLKNRPQESDPVTQFFEVQALAPKEETVSETVPETKE